MLYLPRAPPSREVASEAISPNWASAGVIKNDMSITWDQCMVLVSSENEMKRSFVRGRDSTRQRREERDMAGEDVVSIGGSFSDGQVNAIAISFRTGFDFFFAVCFCFPPTANLKTQYILCFESFWCRRRRRGKIHLKPTEVSLSHLSVVIGWIDSNTELILQRHNYNLFTNSGVRIFQDSYRMTFCNVSKFPEVDKSYETRTLTEESGLMICGYEMLMKNNDSR